MDAYVIYSRCFFRALPERPEMLRLITYTKEERRGGGGQNFGAHRFEAKLDLFRIRLIDPSRSHTLQL